MNHSPEILSHFKGYLIQHFESKGIFNDFIEFRKDANNNKYIFYCESLDTDFNILKEFILFYCDKDIDIIEYKLHSKMEIIDENICSTLTIECIEIEN